MAKVQGYLALEGSVIGCIEASWLAGPAPRQARGAIAHAIPHDEALVRRSIMTSGAVLVQLIAMPV